MKSSISKMMFCYHYHELIHRKMISPWKLFNVKQSSRLLNLEASVLRRSPRSLSPSVLPIRQKLNYPLQQNGLLPLPSANSAMYNPYPLCFSAPKKQALRNSKPSGYRLVICYAELFYYLSRSTISYRSLPMPISFI